MLSGQATLRVPGTTDTSNPAAIGYTDVETDFRALLGHSFMFGGMPAFVDLEVAQRLRAGGRPTSSAPMGRSACRCLPRWLLLAQSFNVISEGAGSRSCGGSYEYYKLQLSAVYSLTATWSRCRAAASPPMRAATRCRRTELVFGVWYSSESDRVPGGWNSIAI